MPNDDACIIRCSAQTSQTSVLIENSDVHFLNDKDSCYNTGSSSIGWVEQLWWILKINEHFRPPVGAVSNRTE